MDLTKFESYIEALESELSSPTPQHFNLTRLVNLGFKEIGSLLRLLHSNQESTKADVLCRTNETTTAAAVPTVTLTVVSPEETPPEVDAKIEIPVASPVTESPTLPPSPEAEG